MSHNTFHSDSTGLGHLSVIQDNKCGPDSTPPHSPSAWSLITKEVQKEKFLHRCNMEELYIPWKNIPTCLVSDRPLLLGLPPLDGYTALSTQKMKGASLSNSTKLVDNLCEHYLYC